MESVELLQPMRLPSDELGQEVRMWARLEGAQASVQPLSQAAAEKMGLQGEEERLRLFFYPSVALKPRQRLSLRKKIFEIERVSVWGSHTEAVARKVGQL